MLRAAPADRLFEGTLLGMLLSGYLALAVTGELPPVALFLVLAAFVLRGLKLNPLERVPGAYLSAAVIAFCGYTAVDVYWLSGDFLSATIWLICFLVVAKGLTFRTDRDAFWTVMISFLELVAAALLSSSLLFFLFLVSFVVCGVGAFAAWEIRRGARGARVSTAGQRAGFFRRTATVSLLAASGIIVFTVVLFFVLPRTARAALQSFVTPRIHLPGYGGEVDLRKIGEIQASSRTIMFVRIAGQPDQLPLYWRGSAMSKFDGRRWTTAGDLAEQVRLRYGTAGIPIRNHQGRRGVRARYDVQLAETGMNALFVAGIPEFLEANLGTIAVLSNGTLRSLSEMPPVLRYSVTAFFDSYGADGTATLDREARRRLLEVPLNFDIRVLQLTQQVAGSENNPALQARRIVDYLRTNYTYTLELPSEERDDPVGHFLLERKQGHCEYFASSMALMLRSIGIPARVATGFRGGVFNPVSGWYTVKASDAHSWVEAFIPGHGWTTYDPTPAVAMPAQWAALSRVAHLIEAADLFWQDWVLQYDLDRQFRLAAQLETTRMGTRGWSVNAVLRNTDGWRAASAQWVRERAAWLIGAALTLALAWVAGPYLVRRVRERKQRDRLRAGEAAASDATVLYRNLLTLLEEHDIHKPEWFTPIEFARKLPPSELSAQIATFTHAYNRLRYSGDTAAAAQMLAMFDAIRATLYHSATEPSS